MEEVSMRVQSVSYSNLIHIPVILSNVGDIRKAGNIRKRYVHDQRRVSVTSSFGTHCTHMHMLTRHAPVHEVINIFLKIEIVSIFPTVLLDTED